MLDLTVPGMVEEEDAHASLREAARDEVVVLAEHLEAQLEREPRLVRGRTLRVVPPARMVGPELADRLEVHGLPVIEQAFLPQPRLRDHPPPLGARGDEVQLVPGRDELLEDGGAVLVDLELAEELTVVQLHPEAIALLGRDALETRNELVVRRVLLHPRQQVPSDLLLVRQHDAELLGELPQVGHGADRHHVVEVDADPHGESLCGGIVAQSPTSSRALNVQCAATLAPSERARSRSAASATPPTKTMTSAPATAGTNHGEGGASVVSPTVTTATAACQSANVTAEPTTAARVPVRRRRPNSVPRNASSSGKTTPSGRKTAMCAASWDTETRDSGS